jgi:IMP dehydrogenase/GMP reductase
VSKSKNKYFIIEYVSEIVAAGTKEEALAIAKQRVQDRDVQVDEESICLVEDKDLLKEIEEDQRKADEEEARAFAKPKK